MPRFTFVPVQTISAVLFVAALVINGLSPLHAQTSDRDFRLLAWLGCWQPSDASEAARSSLVCVVPATGSSAVDIVTLSGGKEIARERLHATGERIAVNREGCSGWERAHPSADGRRVYVQSELTCAGEVKRSSSGLFAISYEGDWLDVRGVNAGGRSGLSGVRYRDAGVPAGVPAGIASALTARRLAVSAARSSAGARIRNADIVDAVKNADEGVVQGWLVARAETFDVSASQLASLADAGVPGGVTDVMLALTYPRVFALDLGPLEMLRPQNTELSEGDDSRLRGRSSNVYVDRYGSARDLYSPYGYSPYGYSPYGYSPYGYSAYGYGPYRYSSYGYGSYFNRFPYVIVTKGTGAESARGRAVNGRGYTRGDRASGSGRPTVSRPRGSTGSSGSGSGSRPTGSGGRTAKPRR